MKMRGQSGVVTVEFAIIGLVLLVVLFGVIEFGRLLFVVNTLTEGTRRGARLAAVCPVGDPKPASAAIFDSGNGSSSVIYGLSTGNVAVEYLDANGTVIASPGTAANFNSIRYVRARIVGFNLQLFIPPIMPTVPLNGLSTTMPRESLGIPRAGAVQPC